MCLPPCSWPTIPSAKNNWDTRNVFLRRANVTTEPFVSPPGSSWCYHPMAGIHKLRWAFDMNLDVLPGCGSAPEKWKMPLRQLGAVQRSQGGIAALGRTLSEEEQVWKKKRCLLTSFIEQQWASCDQKCGEFNCPASQIWLFGFGPSNTYAAQGWDAINPLQGIFVIIWVLRVWKTRLLWSILSMRPWTKNSLSDMVYSPIVNLIIVYFTLALNKNE